MTKKIPELPGYLLQQAKAKPAIQLIAELTLELDDTSLITDQAWRAKMDELGARLTRLEEAVKRQQIAKGV